MNGNDLEENVEEIFHLMKLYKELAHVDESVKLFRLPMFWKKKAIKKGKLNYYGDSC